jgi:signal peptidase I
VSFDRSGREERPPTTGLGRTTAGSRPSASLAAVLSLIAPGVGHVYAGAPARGALAWLGTRLVVLLALAAVVLLPGGWGLAWYAIGICAALVGVARDAARVAGQARPRTRSPWYRRLFGCVIACAAVIIGTMVWAQMVDSRIADRLRIPTDTMAPTLLAGDRVIATPRLGPVVHGTMVVYRRWETRYVKRVLGVPGDTLAMKGGRLSVNGRSVDEPYAVHGAEDELIDRRFDWQRRYVLTADPARYAPTLATWGPLVIPAHAYFVLGDNRGQSVDSRYNGFVPDTAIIGRPLTIYFSRDPITGWIRWQRLGAEVGKVQ